MMISTKGRYALRVMVDIAENQRDGYIPLKEILFPLTKLMNYQINI